MEFKGCGIFIYLLIDWLIFFFYSSSTEKIVGCSETAQIKITVMDPKGLDMLLLVILNLIWQSCYLISV